MKKALLSVILFFVCTLIPASILPNQALMAGTQKQKPGGQPRRNCPCRI